MSIKVTVIGLGRVGAQYPDIINKNNNETIRRSHLSALLNDPAYEIISLIDIDPEALRKTSILYPDIEQDIFKKNIIEADIKQSDLVVMCTPPENRHEEISVIIKSNPKYIFIEKPLATTLSESIKIKSLIESSDTVANVNFNRRYESSIQKFKYLTKENPAKVIFRYSKGLLNYGSHMIDFALDWFGEIESVQSIGHEENDLTKSISFIMHAKKGFDLVCIGINDVEYEQFEMDIYFPDKAVFFANGYNEKWIKKACPELYYPSYTHLDNSVLLDEVQPVGNLAEIYNALKGNVNKKNGSIGCSLDDAIYGMKVIDAVIESAKLNKKIYIN